MSENRYKAVLALLGYKGVWIPAFAGMTEKDRVPLRYEGVWIPAFAGMTEKDRVPHQNENRYKLNSKTATIIKL